jgi:hypothetical protein
MVSKSFPLSAFFNSIWVQMDGRTVYQRYRHYKRRRCATFKGMLPPFIWVRFQFLDQSRLIKVYCIGSQLGEVNIDQSWQSSVQPELRISKRLQPLLSPGLEGYDGTPCLCRERVVWTLQHHKLTQGCILMKNNKIYFSGKERTPKLH